MHYAIWRLDPTRETSRQSAARLYSELYAATPDIDFRERYLHLTGDALPEPLALPELPALVPDPLPDLEPLLGRVDQMLDELLPALRD